MEYSFPARDRINTEEAMEKFHKKFPDKEMDFIAAIIYQNIYLQDRELARIVADKIAFNIREEIKKISILRFIELEKLLHPDWNMELEIRRKELRHFLKALGIEEGAR